MSRDICIFQSFLTEALRERIADTAEEIGFIPHFFSADQFEAASACLQHCEILYAQSPALLRTAPASLKWYCSSTAGGGCLLRRSLRLCQSDCLLTNFQRLRALPSPSMW